MGRKELLGAIIGVWAMSSGCSTPKKAATPTIEVKIKDTTVLKKNFLKDLLLQYPQYFDTLLNGDSIWHIQIIYTQIDRKATGKILFTHHYFNLNPAQYYYPASTVKLPVVALALQRLHELNIPELSRNNTFITEAGAEGQTSVYNDPSAKDGRPSIAQDIKKILLVSDNDAFNRLYEFLGQEYINATLHKMGYDSIQILHHLNIALTEEQNRTANPITFYDSANQIIYKQPLVRSNMPYLPRKDFFGTGHYKGDSLLNGPFDFSKKNRLSLVDLHSILESIMFPEAVPEKQRFHLTEEDYDFLHRYMSMYPKESDYPQYDTSYNDSYVKFLLYGAHDAVDSNIRIFNKVGDAYGFLTDAAYIVDFKNGIEFLLSATISCNSDGIFNDDKYDYENVGFPFMKHLGQVIYQHELGRKRKTIPDLSSFKLNYKK